MNNGISDRNAASAVTKHVTRTDGTTVSYDCYGEGPPLVLVHGSFSDHVTNWQEVQSLLADRFTVYAVARRGRGDTSPTQNHSVDDEMADIASVLDAVGRPAFLLGHSYGAVCALGAARLRPFGIRKLILYEHLAPTTLTALLVARLERFANSGDWDRVVHSFMLDALQIPHAEVEMIKKTPFWGVWTADAKATLNDLRALVRHKFDVARYRSLDMPVLLLIGTESPRSNYLTDVLNAVLPNATIRELEGQAHEGMTTAPGQFVDVISQFLLRK